MAVLTPNRPLLIVLLPGLFLFSSCRTILSGYNVIPTAEITPKMQWALVVVYSRFKLGNYCELPSVATVCDIVV